MPDLVKAGGGALAPAQQVEQLAGALIKTPQELAQRIRDMAQHAHVLSPAIAISSIAPGHVVNTAVVVIDTQLPPANFGSSAGSDVYYQSSIHSGKSRKVGEDWVTEVGEVSINKNGLVKILGAAGVDITRSERTGNTSDSYYWAWATEGEIVDFDGRRRRLPPGNVEIDYRDGSASIGEWTPEKWAQRVAEAESKRAAAKSDAERKKIKPEPINGWSEDRVRNARRFGLRIAEAESLNRLIRNLGIKQKYTLDELKKPFVIFRCSWQPDMNNPVDRERMMDAHLGASRLLYGKSPAATGGDVIDVHASSPDAPAATGAAAPAPRTAAPSESIDLDEIPDDPQPDLPAEELPPIFLITRLSTMPIEGVEHFFFETREGRTFVTDDRGAARALNAAKKAGTPIPIEGERCVINSVEYFRVLGATAPAGQGSLLPDPSRV